MSAQRLAYWLIPSAREHRVLSGLIGDLASALGSPVFEPHVTVYLTRGSDQLACRVLDESSLRFRPFTLEVDDVRCGDIFTKTLFVKFNRSVELDALSAFIGEKVGEKDGYTLEPHLSLVYKDTNRKEREALRSEVRVPFESVRFDRLKAIASQRKTRVEADVADWREIAKITLGSVDRNGTT